MLLGMGPSGWANSRFVACGGPVLTAPHQPVAESLRRAPPRFDPAQASQPRSRSRRQPPAPHPGQLLPLLSWGSHASHARQGCAGRQARRAPRGGQDRGDSRSRWPASPLRPPSGVVQHRPSSLPSDTRHRSDRAARPSPSSIATTVRPRKANRRTMPVALPPTRPGGLGPVDGLTDLRAAERVG